MAKYPELESPPALGKETEARLFGTPKNGDDSVDNLILYALHSNCVHWLVTQDDGIHKKAKKIGEDERVLTVDQAIRSLAKQDTEECKIYPNIWDVPCHTLELTSSFFDSLREGYDEC